MRRRHVGLPEVEENWPTSRSFPNLSLMSKAYRVNPKEVLWGNDWLVFIWAIRERFPEEVKFELCLER